MTVDIDIFERLNDSGVAFVFNSLSKSRIFHCKRQLCYKKKNHFKTKKMLFSSNRDCRRTCIYAETLFVKISALFLYGHLCYEIQGKGEKYRYRVYEPAGMCGLDLTTN